MNKKGFTLIELITTFALAAVIFVILINILVLIKDIYTNSNLKTELLINQANLSNVLNSKLSNGSVTGYSKCTDSDFCYIFKLEDTSNVKLVVTNNKIKFGDFVYSLIDSSKISAPKLTSSSDFLHIKIPIENKMYQNEDFGINLVYLGYVPLTSS